MGDKNILEELCSVILSRREEPVEGSYTSYLFEKGLDKVLKKVGEEATEVIIASKNDSRDDIILEISDLVYHVLVLMAMEGIEIKDIENELSKRRDKICNKKPERRPIGPIELAYH